jgi:hypothetical protein
MESADKPCPCVLCCAVLCCANFQDKDALRGHRHVSKERGLTSPRSDKKDKDDKVGVTQLLKVTRLWEGWRIVLL